MAVSAERPFVSIIVPCRNEIGFIDKCLDSILANDYPRDRLEILVLDGMSEDGTREVIEDYIQRTPVVKLLDNRREATPSALNAGIRHSRGDLIIIMGAHSTYPCDYISKLVEWLLKSGADNVGGVCRARPAKDTPMGIAIALALAHPFGVGNAYFRTGSSSPRWVDTVFGGCYRREVFDRIGLFDEELIRNQDDEFNHRLIKHGGRILLVPDVVSHYFARDSLQKLAQMYYQYGYFKPLAALKVGKVMTMRQLIPGLFVLSLVFTASLAPLFGPMRLLLAAVVISYAALAVVFSTSVAFDKGVRCSLWLSLVFPVLHFSYGLGYLKGILDFLILRKTRTHNPTAVPLSR